MDGVDVFSEVFVLLMSEGKNRNVEISLITHIDFFIWNLKKGCFIAL